jgi:peptide/nickel transport system permease protein
MTVEIELAHTDLEAPAPRQRLHRRLLRTGRAKVGLGLIVATVLVALLGPLFAPHTASEIVSTPYAPPGDGIPLGADNLGHDVLSRLLWGGRSLVWMSLTAAVLSVAVGTLIGLVAAQSRGFTDGLLMRSVDILLAFPSIVLVLLVVALLGPEPWLLVLLVALSQIPSISRVMRGAALPVVTRDFVDWARAAGVPRWTVLWREVLPNVTSPLLVEFGLRLMWCISLLAGLSFLGYGLQPPAADWGLMVNESRNALSTQPWAVLAPITAIAIFTVGGNLLAEGAARSLARTEGAGR